MILYYTGASSANNPQLMPEKSLGGYVSSSNVPNSRLNNLFSGISKSVVIEKRIEVRMLALKNTTGATVTGVKVFTNKGDSSLILSIAAVASATDANNNVIFESIIDGQTLPYQATLASHEGEVNAIDIGSLTANQTIGIWIQREIDTTKFPQLIKQETPLSCTALAAILEDADNNTDEEIQLLIKWN